MTTPRDQSRLERAVAILEAAHRYTSTEPEARLRVIDEWQHRGDAIYDALRQLYSVDVADAEQWMADHCQQCGAMPSHCGHPRVDPDPPVDACPQCGMLPDEPCAGSCEGEDRPIRGMAHYRASDREGGR